MYASHLFNLVYVYLLVFTVESKKLPANFNRCRISDPAVGECLAKNVEDAVRKLGNGSKELSVPPLEPLRIPGLTIGQGTGPVRVQQNFKNVVLSGLTNSTITKYKSDFEHTRFDIDSISPRLEIMADYEMDGNLLLFPIRGQGVCNITLVNARIHHTLLGEMVLKKGLEYIKLNEYNVTIDPEHVHFNFQNLFDGDAALASTMNSIFNDNWRDIYEDVRSGYEQSFGLIFLHFGQRVFKRVAFKDIFLL